MPHPFSVPTAAPVAGENPNDVPTSSARPQLISVVIPVRSGAALLPRQLDALATQTYAGAWEVLIVDNGATEACAKAARAWRGTVPNLRVVDASAHPGKAQACNIGVRASKGDAVLFLDDDDEIEPGYLEAMAEALAGHDFVAAALDCDTLNDGWRRRAREPLQRNGPMDSLRFLPFAAGGSLGVHRAAFEDVGGYSEAMFRNSDVDLCWRLQLAGIPIRFVPQAVLRYRYRHGLRAIYSQAVDAGRAGVLLYRRFRFSGMGRLSLRQGWAEWKRLFWLLGRARTRADWAFCMRVLGIRVGHVLGSVRYGTWYL